MMASMPSLERLRVASVDEGRINRNNDMQILAKGSHAAMLGAAERTNVAQRLMNGQEDINTYMNGVCYDAVAYVRFLLNAAITPNALIETRGQQWLPAFDFAVGTLWMGHAIPAGTALGFQRVGGTFFHAALAVGGTQIRGINGLLLGAGWLQDCNLVPQLQPDANGWSAYDGTQIRVWLSAV